MHDGRLGVIDFGAVNRLPTGLPEPIGRLSRLALQGRAEDVFAGLRAEGFVKDGVDCRRRRGARLPAADPGPAAVGDVHLQPGLAA